MDVLLKENFELRRALVYERKRYLDLNLAYSDLKASMNEESRVETVQIQASPRPSEHEGSRPGMQWKLERNSMQQTILSLSQEVEYLSVQNEKLLSDVRKKAPTHNYYDVYVKTQEELVKLR